MRTNKEKEMFNCPNCAATIEGEKCPYCGTVFYDFGVLELGKPSYLKIRQGNALVFMRLVVDEFNIKYVPEFVEYGANGINHNRVLVSQGYEIDLHAHTVCTHEDSAMITCIVEEERK